MFVCANSRTALLAFIIAFLNLPMPKETIYQGLPALELNTPQGDRAIITLHGAHLVSWQTADGHEQLYMSPQSAFASGKAIRGGVPVIFPQFSARGPFVRHGFARTRTWQHLPDDTSAPHQATLRLQDDAETRALWPFAFACDLSFTLEPDALSIAMTVRNPGDASFVFTAALHSYWSVGTLASARVSGLQNVAFEEIAVPGMQTDAVLQPTGAMDRIYARAPAGLILESDNGILGMEGDGFTNTVVWNLGAKAAEITPDMPFADHDAFVCVEAALIEPPQTLASGQQWQGIHTLRRVLRPHPEPRT
jgi:glucose-6-phosphate 1-epimerase